MCGRLGNQLFQYAFARKVQLATGQELAIDFTAIDQVKRDEWKNYLDQYNVHNYKIVHKNDYYPIQRYIYKLLRIIRPRKNEERQYHFDEFIAKNFSKWGIVFYESDFKCHRFDIIKAKNIVIRGWFESEQYFDEISEELKKEFTLKQPLSAENRELYNKLKNSESICVTVRRGAFTEDKYKKEFLVCTPEYYYKSVECIRRVYPDTIVYVCSDDIEWCKKSLKFSGDVLFEPQNSVCEKLELMSACRHFVLSNSTFSWWAQYLSDNEEKMVISPTRWRNCELPPTDIFGKDWFYLNRIGEISHEREDECVEKD
jgi:hypothetical protein